MPSARPARVLLTAFGSRGDVMPRVALGQELRRRGVAVTIGCAEQNRPLVDAYGLPAIALGDYPPADVMAQAYARMARNPDAASRGEQLLAELFVPLLPGLQQRLDSVQDAFDFVVLNDLLSMFAVPPLVAPARFAVALTTQPLGGFAPMLQESPCIKLVGSSPLLLPAETGLDARFVITDFWLPEPIETFRPDPVLSEFLTRAATPAGAPARPIVAVALGSAWGTDPAMTHQVLAGAARRAGVRLIVQDHAPAPGTSAVSADGDVASVGEVPYGWLFPYADAVVHHGGAGTIAEALRAKCPSITVPHYGDHVYWAHRLDAAGVSAGTLTADDVNEVALAECMERAVHDADLRQRVAVLGAAVDIAGGVRRASDRIVALAQEAISANSDGPSRSMRTTGSSFDRSQTEY
jgi:UDP:flavonoid glycosyltransferase YjiC (YdhE family)